MSTSAGGTTRPPSGVRARVLGCYAYQAQGAKAQGAKRLGLGGWVGDGVVSVCVGGILRWWVGGFSANRWRGGGALEARLSVQDGLPSRIAGPWGFLRLRISWFASDVGSDASGPDGILRSPPLAARRAAGWAGVVVVASGRRGGMRGGDRDAAMTWLMGEGRGEVRCWFAPWLGVWWAGGVGGWE